MLNAIKLKNDAIVPISLITFYTFNIRQDYYFGKWALLVAFGAILLVNEIRKRTDTPFALFVGYCLLSSIACSLLRVGEYRIAKDSILYETLKNTVYLSAALLIFLHAPLEKFKKWVPYLQGGNVALTLFCLLQHRTWMSFTGMDYNISVNSTLMALMLPFCLAYRWLVIATVGVQLFAGSAMGLVASGGVILAYYWILSPRKKLAAGLIGLNMGIWYWVTHSLAFWDDSGRLHVWKFIVKIITMKDWWFFGSGSGSFSFLMPVAGQLVEWERRGYKQSFWWAHNDLLQGVWELGLVGVTLGLIVAVRIIWKAQRHPLHLPFLVAWGISMMGNFPFHLASSVLLLLIVINSIYSPEVRNEEV